VDYYGNNKKPVELARTAEDDAQLSENASPLEKAKFCASIAFGSLPATIKSLALGYHTEFLALQMELLCLSKIKERLLQPDHIPVSTRIKFDLSDASKQVMEHARDAQFQDLIERTTCHLTFYQIEIKAELIKLTALEEKLAHDALNSHFCKSVLGVLGICYCHQSS
jgi:hypothetical protein